MPSSKGKARILPRQSDHLYKQLTSLITIHKLEGSLVQINTGDIKLINNNVEHSKVHSELSVLDLEQDLISK